ncbi:MAG: Ig-like domain-containing protein [Proteobacteria bacterium]|nr:Ig-like domain-containing protein [Pseudomonadota bacterium]MBU1688456.1 Ig-like domain-containing protein [Pseudomonadota bacterium]
MKTLRLFGILFCLVTTFYGCSSYSKPDETLPLIQELSPHDGAQNVQAAPEISATFSEPVQFVSVGLTDGDGNAISGQYSGYDTTKVTFVPDTTMLTYGAVYTVTIREVTDRAGNSLGNITWSFLIEGTDQSVFWDQPTTPGSHNDFDGVFNSIVISPTDGSLVIAYYDTDNESCAIMTRSKDGNLFSDLNPVDTQVMADNITLSVDESGYHALYTNRSGELRYATSATPAGPWVVSSLTDYYFKGVLPYYNQPSVDDGTNVSISWLPAASSLGAANSVGLNVRYNVFLAPQDDITGVVSASALRAEKYLVGTTQGQNSYNLRGLQSNSDYYAMVEARTGSSQELLNTTMADGVTLEQFLNVVGFSLAQLVSGGISQEELLAAGFTQGQLLSSDFSVSQLLNAGITLIRLVEAVGYTTNDLVAAGFSLTDLDVAVSIGDLLDGGFPLEQLLAAAGLTVNDIYAAGVSLEQQYNIIEVSTREATWASYDPTLLVFPGFWANVDSSLFTGRAYGAMTLDPSGKAHVTYYDFYDSALRYATNASAPDGIFSNSIIDSGEPNVAAGQFHSINDQPGRFSSIEYDTSGLSQGQLHVSYYDFHIDNYDGNGNGNLKYALFNSDVPEQATVWAVDTTGEIGKYSSLALYQGDVYISYLDLTHMTIKLMNNELGTGGFFESEIFVSNIVEETNVPIVIDPNGFIHMSYFNDCVPDTGEEIMVDFCYAVKALTTEVNQPVDDGGVSNGVESSLVYNANDGKIHFAYYDLTDHDLRYARQK